MGAGSDRAPAGGGGEWYRILRGGVARRWGRRATGGDRRNPCGPPGPRGDRAGVPLRIDRWVALLLSRMTTKKTGGTGHRRRWRGPFLFRSGGRFARVWRCNRPRNSRLRAGRQISRERRDFRGVLRPCCWDSERGTRWFFRRRLGLRWRRSWVVAFGPRNAC